MSKTERPIVEPAFGGIELPTISMFTLEPPANLGDNLPSVGPGEVISIVKDDLGEPQVIYCRRDNIGFCIPCKAVKAANELNCYKAFHD